MKEDILEAAHKDRMAGHLGFEQTFKQLRQKYWWIGMWTDVKTWV